MPIVEKKDALLDAINVAATARGWMEKTKKRKLIRHIQNLEIEIGRELSSFSRKQSVHPTEGGEGEDEDWEGYVHDSDIEKGGSKRSSSKSVSILHKFSFSVGQESSSSMKGNTSLKSRCQRRMNTFFLGLRYGGTSTSMWVSRQLVRVFIGAFRVKESTLFTRFRQMLTVLCYIDSLIACDRERLEEEGNYDGGALEKLDISVNVCFIILGVARVLVFPLFIAYGDHTKSYIDHFLFVFRKSGVFDVGIGALSLVYLSDTDVGKWLRLMRMTVISIILVDSIDSLDVLLSGIWNGVRSIKYSLAIMGVVTLSWGFMCERVFAANDPYHFGGLGTSMWTLVEVMTLDGWRSVVDINTCGCGDTKYETYYEIYTPLLDCSNTNGCDMGDTAGVYANMTFATSADLGIYGKYKLPYCDPDFENQRPVASGLLFNSYIVITAFILWNLNTAAVTTGISERVEQLKEDSKVDDPVTPAASEPTGTPQPKTPQHDANPSCVTIEEVANVAKFTARMNSLARQPSMMTKGQFMGRDKLVDVSRMRQLLKNAWQEDNQSFVISQTRSEHLATHEAFDTSLHYLLVWFNFTIAPFVHTSVYVTFMDAMAAIAAVVTVVCVSAGTMPMSVEIVIQFIFTVDIIFTALAAYPSMSSFTSWDHFDVVITLFTWPLVVPAVANNELASCLHALRVIKCLRILDQFPDVKVIFQSLVSSLAAFGYVAGLIVLVVFHFAMAASYLFRRNDPFHFRSFWPSVQTMFQMATLDDWSAISRLNMIGCDYSVSFMEIDPLQCTCGTMTPEGNAVEMCGWGWVASLFFLVFIVLVVIILMNLLIAIIIASMEMLRDSMIHEKLMWEKVNEKVEEYSLSNAYVTQLLKVFDMLDLELNGRLSLNEIMPILELVSVQNDTQLKIFHEVDRDGSGSIDFAEFCELVHLLKMSHDFIKKDKHGKGKHEVTTAEKLEDLLNQSVHRENTDPRASPAALEQRHVHGERENTISGFLDLNDDDDDNDDDRDNDVPSHSNLKVVNMLAADANSMAGLGFGSPFETPDSKPYSFRIVTDSSENPPLESVADLDFGAEVDDDDEHH